MANSSTWMPLYVGDYLRDTGHLTGTEHGGYLLLLMHAWTHGGELPSDDDRLRRIAKMHVRQWSQSRDILRSFFVNHEGVLRHKRLDAELRIAQNRIGQRKAAGKASAEARARQRSFNVETPKADNGKSTDVEISLEQNAVPSPSPSPSPKKVPSLRSGTHRNTRLPEDWKPDAKGIAYAEKYGLSPADLEAFRDHHISHGTLMDRWDLAWRTWCRNSVKFGKAPSLPNFPSNNSGVSV